MLKTTCDILLYSLHGLWKKSMLCDGRWWPLVHGLWLSRACLLQSCSDYELSLPHPCIVSSSPEQPRTGLWFCIHCSPAGDLHPGCCCVWTWLGEAGTAALTQADPSGALSVGEGTPWALSGLSLDWFLSHRQRGLIIGVSQTPAVFIHFVNLLQVSFWLFMSYKQTIYFLFMWINVSKVIMEII